MAKRKKEQDLVEASEEDIDAVSYYMTNLIAIISPTIHKGETYELLYEMFSNEVSEATVETYGHLIRGTALKAPHGVH